MKNAPLEINNMFGYNGYEEVWERLRERLLELRDEWEDESHPFGKQYWDLYRAYEKAVPQKKQNKPKKRNLAGQIGITQ